MRLVSFPTLVLFSSLIVSSSAAQSIAGVEQGIKPYGSYEGGNIDSISMVNGSLTLNIPLLSYSERGGRLPMSFRLVYSNPWLQPWLGSCNPFTHVCQYGYNLVYSADPTTCGGQGKTCGTALNAISDFGPAIGLKYANTQCCPQPVQYFTVTEPDGAVHELGPVAGGLWRSVDATGYVISPISNPTTGTLEPLGVLWDRQGNRYDTTNGVSQSKFEDPNGNLITANANAQGAITSYTDTLGRSIPVPSGSSTTDLSHCPASATTAYVWSPPGPNSGTSQFKSCWATINITASTPSSTATEMVGLVLPNLTAWTFSFDSSGDLTTITLPTGGTISYTWTSIYGNCVAPQVSVSPSLRVWPYRRAVTSRTVNANDGSGPHTWNYALSTTDIENTSLQTVVTDPLGNDAVHSQTPLGNSCSIYETELDRYSGSHTNGTRLRKTTTTYNYSASGGSVGFGNVVINVVPSSVTTTDVPSGKTSQNTKVFDSGVALTYTWGGTAIYGDLLTENDYDFGNGSPGPLMRQTNTTYMAFSGPNPSSYLANNLISLPYTVQILDGSGSQKAYTFYGYDEYALTNVGAVTTQHDSAPPAGNTRGNLTSGHRWLNGSTVSTTNCPISVSNGYLVSYDVYNDTGTLDHSVDSCGSSASDANHKTSFAYSSTYAGAYPTSATNPLGQTATKAYDFNTGLLTSVTDPNNQATTYSYDSMWRISQINHPDRGQDNITHQESSFPFTATLTTKINSSQNFVKTNVFDGLGRISQTQLTSDLAGTDYTDTTYDALGRVATVSNPHRSTASPTDGTTTFLYDTLGRTTQVTRPDGATVLTTYIGPATESRDESRMTRISQSDGLGRLTSVCEVSSATLIGTSGTPAACGQDIAATGFLTTYQYDALDNLTQVNQGGLNPRTFSYNSLSRLTSATNPESGTICYGTYSGSVCQGNGYDADGNLTTKTDARSITTTYSYDALNRLTQKTYSDTTPKAVFNYDETAPWGWTLSNPIGRLTTTYTKNSSGGTIVSSLNSYDPMGRVAVYEQCQPLSCGSAPSLALAYTYNLLGEPISMQPSQTNVFNFTLSYSYNSTAHLATITSSLNDANHPQTVFSGASYNAPALLTTATLGGIVNEHRSYNSRLWPTSITVDSSVYSYSITSYAPNGNILGVNDSVNGNWVYKYDDFNRLTCSNLSSNGTCAAPTNGTPTYTYDYDRFGNRWHQNGPQSMQFSFSGNNNRMDGYSYNAAGNLSNDGNYVYTYDAENRIIQVNLPGPGGALVATYTYDASGNRVSKTSGGVSLAYFYDTEGHVVVETNLNTSPATWTRGEIFAAGRHIATYSGGTSGTTNFIETDWLGTERVRTNHSGAVCETINSLPFGDGQSTSTSCGDLSPLHFTGKERDPESNLDYFGARYNSSSFGRFMSPDWSASPEPVPYAKLDDPQSLNLYIYASDNPLVFTDPNGHCWWEKLCNLWNYGVWADDAHLEAALQKEADAARSEFKKGNIQRGGEDPDEYLKGKSNKQVLDLWHEFISSGVRGTLGAVGMLGANGAQFTSKTVWQEGKARIDVENPAPGKRAGQIHYQEGPEGAAQFRYDPKTGNFPELSATKNKELLNNPEVQKAIQKALKYLGEGQ